jgi:uncharacterized protein (TIGR03118 family)
MLTRHGHGPRTPRSGAPRDQKRRKQPTRLHVELLEERCLPSIDPVLEWNQAVLAAIRADRPTLGFLTRDLAIVHTAIYDAVNAIDQTSTVLHVQADAPAGASPKAAADAAGLFTAAALFPTDTALFQATYQAVLADVPDGQGKTDGLAVGRFVAEQTLISRVTDGANAVVDYTPGTNPGDWRPTLPAFAPAQTPQWPGVTPFALDSGSQFRPAPPPALTSAEYTAAFNEVKDFGRLDSTVRTPEQTEVAKFWEGKAGTANFPGYWNEIAANAAISQGNTLDQNARLFAELNVAQADAVIGHFDAKYTYNRWRPITAIQLADQTGNPDTVADPNWLPLNNTPPNPSYLSGHGAVSGAASTVLATFFGTDNINFSLTSDDLPGVAHSFTSFSAAATESENSVVWAGLHFRFDAEAGQVLGQSVAQFVAQHFFQPAANAVFRQTNIVSSVPGLAASVDHNLINPWGLSLSPTGQFRVSDNGLGLSTVYDVHGNPHATTVEIPLPPGSTSDLAAPTGNIRNTTADFVISENGRSAPAENIFAAEDGTITAWSPTVDRHHALLEADNSAGGAVYKALTLGSNAQGNFIYATNFHDGTVDVFDGKFHQVALAGSFTDPNIPAGFAPFGIRNVNGTIFVTYALQNDARHDDVAGPGNGYIDEFDTDGNLIQRFASQGPLNSPHGIAVAPADFGAFGGALLVGNFGDGRINAFDLGSGRFLGQLSDAGGHPLTNVGIWGMTFGNGAGGTKTNTLYFAAGINGEQDGLFASISPARVRHRSGTGDPGRHQLAAPAASQSLDALLALPALDAVRHQLAAPAASQSLDALLALHALDAVFAQGNWATEPAASANVGQSLEARGATPSLSSFLSTERRDVSSPALKHPAWGSVPEAEDLGSSVTLDGTLPG